MVRNAHLMDGTPLVDVLGQVKGLPELHFGPGLVTVELPPRSVVVLQPRPAALGGYSRYKHVP